MFESYTEKARRAVFFARYEASRYGSPAIETEHLLLGLIRENVRFARFRLTSDVAAAIRKQIDAATPAREPISTATDLPLTMDSQHVLAFAAEEAEHFGDKQIGTEHLFLGLFREEKCLAAQILKPYGVNLSQLRTELAEGRLAPPLPIAISSPSSHAAPAVKDTINLHGATWNTEYILDAVTKCREYQWHWRLASWIPRDIVIQRKSGAVSFDLTLAEDSANFNLVKGGWKKDHCAIRHWDLFESADSPRHGMGYTNGLSWLCTECYQKFLSGSDFFSSSYDDIT